MLSLAKSELQGDMIIVGKYAKNVNTKEGKELLGMAQKGRGGTKRASIIIVSPLLRKCDYSSLVFSIIP